MATDILADYAADRPQSLADLLMDADDNQFAVIYPKFKEQGERGLPVLTGEIDKKLPPELPSSDEQREKLAKHQANAAVALLRMNQPEKVWPLLKHTPDPRVRSYLIHRFRPLGADTGAIVKRMDEELDITIRRALLLSLGEFGENELSPDDRNALLSQLQEMYLTASDPGLHASVEWLLRQWKLETWLTQVNNEWAKDNEGREKKIAGIKELVTNEKEKTPPQWYVNGQGQTMVVIPGPVEFMMGSPPTEIGRNTILNFEQQHKKRIGRTFSLAAKLVTVEQYRQFNKSYELPDKYIRTANLPANQIAWYHAVAYCNWLSKDEGCPEHQWCYEIKENETKLKADYLSLAGYRLPTEAEMEYATRAGAVTSRYYGETDELLSKYAWHLKNSQEQTWPVATLKPNDLGFFDMQGNVYTHCQDAFGQYPSTREAEVVEDREHVLEITGSDIRLYRGGSFYSVPTTVRSAQRDGNVPTSVNPTVGFRVARTFKNGPVNILPSPNEVGRQ